VLGRGTEKKTKRTTDPAADDNSDPAKSSFGQLWEKSFKGKKRWHASISGFFTTENVYLSGGRVAQRHGRHVFWSKTGGGDRTVGDVAEEFIARTERGELLAPRSRKNLSLSISDDAQEH